ncbi:hypothetical protein J437_LFUL004868 [Ladona fulva]|uniref:ASD2 domain-containing protein n=1 Tax=Ladona fulva TaxID=123851 RepID=A0A8K0NWL3_LADFU|nr:hypothetical protein J437_LFUL004868 [Ladona fulva]
MHRRGSEKGMPNFEGSYKRTMSPPSAEALHLAKQGSTPVNTSDSKSPRGQHIPGWDQRVPDVVGNTIGITSSCADSSDGDSTGMKGQTARRSRADQMWPKGEASWREDSGIGERRGGEEEEGSDGEEDGERVRNRRRRQRGSGRENGSNISAGSQSRSLTASSSSSSSSTMSSFSVSSISTTSLPGISAPRSPVSIGADETPSDSWAVSHSTPVQQSEVECSVALGKADAAIQTEAPEDEGDKVTEEKGSLEEHCKEKRKESFGSVKRTSSVAVENGSENSCDKAVSPPPSPPSVPPRQDPPSPTLPQSFTEEAECERLSRDLVSLLPPTDKLQGILAPSQEQKRPTDYVSGLFRLDVTPRSSWSKPMPEIPKREKMTEAPLPATSAYFTTSEPKARFLARYGRDVGSGRTGLEQTDSQELQRKKEELMARLSRKLEVLREEAVAVSEEAALNEDLGRGVANQLGQLALPHELSRFKLHVDEIGKVTSLLLALSGRLARAENALALEDARASDNSPAFLEERKTLEGKRDKLRDQLEEAKQLKASIDRRSGSVSAMLSRYLDAESFADYGHFITMKAKLIVDAREVSDKIKLGEEQLAALRETLLSSSFQTSTTNTTTVCQASIVPSTASETTSCQSSSVPESSNSSFSSQTAIPLTTVSN